MGTKLTARIAIKPEDHQKLRVLVALHWGGCIELNDLVSSMIDREWNDAIRSGLVNDSMLEPVNHKGEE